MTLKYTSVGRVNSAYPAVSSVTAITSAVIHDLYAEPVEAEIDGIISKRYSLPLSVTCPILVGIATRETIYRLALERMLTHFPAAQDGKHTLQVTHENDRKMLSAIAEGTIQLISSSGEVVAPDLTESGEIWSTTKDYLPTFHEGDTGDWVRDQSKLDDIEADRDLD
jgi:phage gp36-like protein